MPSFRLGLVARFPALLFFSASFAGLLLLFYAVGGKPWRLSAWAMGYGVVLGFTLQSLCKEPFPRLRVAIAAFLGSILLWVPVVLVTYGLALMAAPIFAAYAAMVLVGTLTATRLQGSGSRGGAL